MSSMPVLTKALEGRSTDASGVVTDDLVADAWRAGRRRRRRGRALAGVAATVAVVTVGLAVPMARDAPPAAPGGGPSGTTHPQRLEAPWAGSRAGRERLADRTGRLAAAVLTIDGDFTPWFGVTAEGLAGQIPGYLEPAPSPDGRYLFTAGADLYGSSDPQDRLVLRDLVAGTERTFSNIAGGSWSSTPAEVSFALSSARPWPGVTTVRWSGDAARVLLRVNVLGDAGWSGSAMDYVLDIASGTMSRAPRPDPSPRNRTQFVGFDPAGDLVYLVWRSRPSVSANLVLVDDDSRRQRTLPLKGDDWASPERRHAAVSPDWIDAGDPKRGRDQHRDDAAVQHGGRQAVRPSGDPGRPGRLPAVLGRQRPGLHDGRERSGRHPAFGPCSRGSGSWPRSSSGRRTRSERPGSGLGRELAERQTQYLDLRDQRGLVDLAPVVARNRRHHPDRLAGSRLAGEVAAPDRAGGVRAAALLGSGAIDIL